MLSQSGPCRLNPSQDRLNQALVVSGVGTSVGNDADPGRTGWKTLEFNAPTGSKAEFHQDSSLLGTGASKVAGARGAGQVCSKRSGKVDGPCTFLARLRYRR